MNLFCCLLPGIVCQKSKLHITIKQMKQEEWRREATIIFLTILENILQFNYCLIKIFLSFKHSPLSCRCLVCLSFDWWIAHWSFDWQFLVEGLRNGDCSCYAQAYHLLAPSPPSQTPLQHLCFFIMELEMILASKQSLQNSRRSLVYCGVCLSVGAVATVPLVLAIIAKKKHTKSEVRPKQAAGSSQVMRQWG